MTGQNYYILTALPTMAEFDGSPPLTPGQLLEYVAENASATTLLKVIFLSDDLLQRQAYITGEITEANPVVLSAAQVSNEEPLPDYLIGVEEQEAAYIAGDEYWRVYYRYAAAAADRLGSSFVSAWVEYEVTLRNAIASARAKALNLDPSDYQLVTELAKSDEDFQSIISEWNNSENAVAGLRILDMARWDWLIRHDGWFTFDNDELAAYAVKLMLLSRRARLGETQQDHEAAQKTNTNLKHERISV